MPMLIAFPDIVSVHGAPAVSRCDCRRRHLCRQRFTIPDLGRSVATATIDKLPRISL